MTLDKFIDVANLTRYNIFLSKNNPYTIDEYMAKVDEVLDAFNNIDDVALGAELIDGVNNEQEMQFRLKVIDEKLKGTNALYFYNGKPYFTNKQQKAINNIMGDKAYTYMSKWISVTEVWHNLSCIIDNTITKMKRLCPQPHNIVKEIEDIAGFLIDDYMEKTETGYHWKKSKVLLAYLCGRLFCDDVVICDTWKMRGIMPNDYWDKLDKLFDMKDLGHSRDTRKDSKPPIGYEKIDDIIKMIKGNS